VLVCKTGAPGCGKSSSGLYEAVVMARKMWKELQWKYFKYYKKKVKPAYWSEIEYSYTVFSSGKNVPCLLSNIPVYVDGKYTAHVGKEHFEQREPLPGYCVLFVDEIGAMLSVDMARERMSNGEDAVNIADFCRLARHYGDWRIVCTEQDGANIYIEVRRVASKNEYMLYQRWVLRPYLFLWTFLIFCKVAINVKCLRKVIIPPLRFLEKLCKSIGYRKYRYLTENNTEHERGMETGKRTFYLPSMLNFRYDERTFRNFYKCRHKKINLHIFDNLVLDDSEVFKKMFLRNKGAGR
jgi:hypothetical protein